VCSVSEAAMPAAADETQSHMESVVVPTTHGFTRSVTLTHCHDDVGRIVQMDQICVMN